MQSMEQQHVLFLSHLLQKKELAIRDTFDVC